MTYATIHVIRFILITILIIVSFLAFTPRSEAYLTTNQEALKLDNHSALFLIEYVFGSEKHALHLPASTHQGVVEDPTKVSYTILDEEGTEVAGKVAGIVFSSAKLEKTGMYSIAKNTANNFTLAVIFTPASHKEGRQYRLQVTHLPFDFDGTQQLQLNPSELRYYTTKLIGL